MGEKINGKSEHIRRNKNKNMKEISIHVSSCYLIFLSDCKYIFIYKRFFFHLVKYCRQKRTFHYIRNAV